MGFSSNVPNIGLPFIILVLLFLHVLGASSLYSRQQQLPTCHGEERAALLQFKESFTIDPSASGYGGAYPKVSTWKSAEGDQNRNCCSWDGVKCDENTGHVTRLDLSSSCLHGSINSTSSLFRLVHLRRLNLADNNFNYSQIPTTIRNLSRLRYLNLSHSVFSGQVPSKISQLSKLLSLDLSGNLDYLSGERLLKLKVPNLGGLVQNLTSLEKLRLSDIIISSTIPDSFANLSFLSYLALRNCDLVGEFPSSFGNLPQLFYLSLSNNKLSGPIPCSLGNITSLNVLQIDQNSLNGAIPESFFYLVNLYALNLFSNELASPMQYSIPSVLENLTFLESLDLSQNQLSGEIPIPAENIAYYSISGNRLTGELPPLMCNLTSLQYLDLSSNKLSGTIPQCLGNFSDVLQALDLRNNTLRGSLPKTYSNKSQLKMLDVSYNQLRGKLPRSLANCMMLKSLVLSENKFSDVFPIWLGNFPELKLLALHHNEFYGVIEDTKENLHFPELRILDMSNNNFTGEFPTEYIFSGNAMRAIDSIGLHKPTYMLGGYNFGIVFTITIIIKGVELHYSKIQEDLRVIDISSNNFHGKIPEFIGNLKGLHILNISNNIFTGSIPSVLENLTLVESLDLSQNQLSGEIPQQLAELTSLAYFNVSYNNLTGSIPQGPQFQTFENTSFEGNPGLCGDPLTKRCQNSNPTAQLPPSSSIEETEAAFEFDWKFVLAGVVSGLVVGVVLSDVVIARKRELFLDIVGMTIRQMKRIRRYLRGY